eukprot:CAMPEP_0118925870 /NCGR_PEP_ID=MMETSP1169-20130426/3681_1 /TAXON_ID=36882 /ORGANISM="Pyramimonas obovata, Strain CCMP722" /LENGTH=102 /DNA_ID=CAMNT_0006867289 /DNA_START=191 /DNA_END=499 /DNA_ORIENTATION=+
MITSEAESAVFSVLVACVSVMVLVYPVYDLLVKKVIRKVPKQQTKPLTRLSSGLNHIDDDVAPLKGTSWQRLDGNVLQRNDVVRCNSVQAAEPLSSSRGCLF